MKSSFSLDVFPYITRFVWVLTIYLGYESSYEVFHASLPPQNFNVHRTFGKWPFKISQTSLDEPGKYLRDTCFHLQIKAYANFSSASEKPFVKALLVPQNAWVSLVARPSVGLLNACNKPLMSFPETLISLSQFFQKRYTTAFFLFYC